jgi:hypothetical protein
VNWQFSTFQSNEFRKEFRNSQLDERMSGSRSSSANPSRARDSLHNLSQNGRCGAGPSALRVLQTRGGP